MVGYGSVASWYRGLISQFPSTQNPSNMILGLAFAVCRKDEKWKIKSWPNGFKFMLLTLRGKTQRKNHFYKGKITPIIWGGAHTQVAFKSGHQNLRDA